MLVADHVTKEYGKDGKKIIAVKDADITLSPGELAVLVGESGCGKTTLSRMLAGIIAPSFGKVLLDGKSVAPPARKKNPDLCRKIQMVLQDGKSALDPRYSVYRSIAEPIRNLLHLSKKEEEERVSALMESVRLPEELAKRRPAELSGGQQKRVCIARALATNPQYLIFDEAVSGLDVLLKEQILKLIKEIHMQTKAATLMITHDMDVALYMADRILVMKDGEIVENKMFTGDTACLTHPYSRLLLAQMDPFAE